MRAILIFALSFLAAFSSASCDFFDIIRHDDRMVNTACKSWRLNAEIGNLVNWTVIPASCENYVGDYMVGGQYTSDVELLAEEALTYAKNLILKGDGKDAWIFDIDDTALSHVTYYSSNHFGATPFNRTSWGEWEVLAEAPAIGPILSLYNLLIEAKVSVFFLTGRGENKRNITEQNLRQEGYTGWTDLILRQEEDEVLTATAYKSARRRELEEQGYQIWGNMGDQWSDIKGYATGNRVFKVPNPMYFIA